MSLPSELVIGAPIGNNPSTWDAVIELAGPASLLVAIRARMSPALIALTSAQDVWQETLLLAWRDRDRPTWQGVGAFRRWLLAIAENRIRDLSDRERSEKRGGGRTATDAVETLASILASATPGRLAAHAEQAGLMERLLAELDGEVREVVRLRLFEELEMKEVAERLGLNLATCKSRFRRGAEEYHRRLKAALRTRS